MANREAQPDASDDDQLPDDAAVAKKSRNKRKTVSEIINYIPERLILMAIVFSSSLAH